MDQQVEIQMDIGNHLETLTFDIALLGKHNIMLGLLWLQQHNLTIHWCSGKVTFISDYCEEYCLTQPASTFLSQHQETLDLSQKFDPLLSGQMSSNMSQEHKKFGQGSSYGAMWHYLALYSSMGPDSAT